MGLLGTLEQQIGGNLLGNVGGNQQGALLQSVIGLVSKSGGLSGLISKFNQNGLGQHVQSWIGKGENRPITGEHVQQVFGNDQIQQVAQQAGVEPSHASNLIAKLLPTVVDKLTPQGQQVNDAEAHQGLSGMLSGGLGSLLSSR